MYKRELVLTNNRNTPFALSNNFTDTFGLIDSLEKCETAQQFCDVANKFHDFNYRWSIDYDGEQNTRLKYVDVLGNVKYLIAYKKENTAAPATLYVVSVTHNFDSQHYAVRCPSYENAVGKMKELLNEEVTERVKNGLESSILEWAEDNVTLVHAGGYDKNDTKRNYVLEDCSEFYVLEVK